MENTFEVPVVTERHFMPYAATLMKGVDRMDLPAPLDTAPIVALARETARFRGELAVSSGAMMPLGITADGDEFDVVMMGDDTGLVAAGVMRSESSPRGAVRAGSVSNGDGGVTISTVQQLAREEPELRRTAPFVVSGPVSDAVSFWPGYTRQAIPVYALLDHGDEICGVVVGSVFDEYAWIERILPGERLESCHGLHEMLENWGAAPLTPVAVYRDSELLGYLAPGSDYNFGRMELTLSSEARPDDSIETSEDAPGVPRAKEVDV